MKYELISIYRAERYSPNSVERDKAIMDAVCEKLGTRYTIYKTREEDIETEGMPLMQRLADAHLPHSSAPLLVLSMARSRKALDILTQMEAEGARVINRPQHVLNTTRSAIDRIMRENDIPCAPLHGDHGWWIKRGDEAAQEKDDVRFAADEKERDIITEEFRKRGITDIVTTAHVDGDLVKFYGVTETAFFHTTYPTDGGFSKFGDESRNGTSRHTFFDISDLHSDASRLAQLTGIEVYGGDCIVRADGSYAIIDFNDWPSFSVCRHDAAEAIATIAEGRKQPPPNLPRRGGTGSNGW